LYLTSYMVSLATYKHIYVSTYVEFRRARLVAIAGFAPVMSELVAAARSGLPALDICNGFQILREAHLLPGALTCNSGLRFITRDLRLRVETTRPRPRGPTGAACRSWCR